ncbi:MAG TPA: hypothetical protein VNM48_02370 [Chloroflexota bacterium]|nr:hypothetical protein [Chloroflexota bacterium]
MPEFVTPDVWVKGGLLEGKHIKAMGEAVWLYMYFQSRVRRTGEHAGTFAPGQLYQHQDAVEALGVPRRRVERWFAALTATDAPYIVATRRRLGYEIAITKYEDLRERANQRRSRPAETGASPEAEIRQNEHSDTPIPVSRYANSGSRPAETGASPDPYIKEARASKQLNRTTDSTEGERERALTPLQLVVNAWLEAINRDPTKAKDYGRFTATGAEIAARGDTPQDVGNCTRYLRTDPWRQETARMPTLADVRDALPQWIDQGRPAKYRPVARSNGRVHAGIGAVKEAFRRQAERGGLDDGFGNMLASGPVGNGKAQPRLPG